MSLSDSGNKEIILEVMKLEGIDTFIYHVNGKVTIPALVDIEKELLEYEDEFLLQLSL